MKKYLSILMVIAVLFSFAACSNNAKNNGSETTANTTEMQKTENTEASASVSGKTLVVYFGVPEDVDTNDVDAVAGASIVVKDGEKVGNIQYVADIIQKNTGADLFRMSRKPLIQQTMKTLLIWQRKSRTAMQDPKSKTALKILSNMTLFLLAIRIGGAICRRLYTPFSMPTILQTKPLFRIILTAEAAFQIPSAQ